MRRGPLRSLSSAWHRCRMVASNGYRYMCAKDTTTIPRPARARYQANLSRYCIRPPLKQGSNTTCVVAGNGMVERWSPGAARNRFTSAMWCDAIESSFMAVEQPKAETRRAHARGLPFHPKSKGRDREPTERRRRRLRQRQRRPLRSTDSGAAGCLGEQTNSQL